MPIIINEFEIVPAPPAEEAAPDQSTPEPSPAEALRPEDVERVIEHRDLRRARLWAD